MNKNTLTTYEVAQYCQVTPRTVIQWVNEGKLKAFRTPGNHSRITIEEFLGFLNRYSMPVPEEFTNMEVNDKKRILIIDDDKGIVDVLRRFLVKEKSYDLETAYDGFEAGEKFAVFKPHLVILDFNLPGLDGFRVCAHLRNNPENKDVKILFISGPISEETIAQMTKLGADGCLNRPFNVEEMKTKLQILFGWNRRAGDRP